jgi:hypothetical protein
MTARPDDGIVEEVLDELLENVFEEIIQESVVVSEELYHHSFT